AIVELFAPLTAEASSGSQSAVKSIGAGLAARGVATEVVPDAAGGVAFRIVALLANEAIGALHEGLAAASKLDLAMRLGVNFPRGPLAWAEIIGLPELRSALAAMHDETPTGIYAPHSHLMKLAAGGAKTFGAGSAGPGNMREEP